MGSLFRRSSFLNAMSLRPSEALGPADGSAVDASTLGKREVRYFLKGCGLAKLSVSFVENGITSFEKLATLIAGPGSSEEKFVEQHETAKEQ